MCTSRLSKCVAAAALVVVVLAGSKSAFAHHHHYPIYVRPYPIVSPIVVRSYPVTPIVYRSVSVVPSNVLPVAVTVTLVNPENSPAPLAFRVRNVGYELAPGAKQTLQLIGPQTIEFDRGGGFGVARQMVGDGLYVFTPSEYGWTLRRQA